MKGICLIEPLFNKTVQGIKTQMRGIISKDDYINGSNVVLSTTDGNQMAHFRNLGSSEDFAGRVARYKIGEVLYLKEPYLLCDEVEGLYHNLYKLNGDELPYINSKWQNKLFMPASAARYFINITDVRAERLQDISDEDCIREGIEQTGFILDAFTYGIMVGREVVHLGNSYREVYTVLIDKIYGKGTWDSNPYVWVYEYELTEK